MKVYPQKNGVPVYNPNGKYWVKLYFMGKEKKIEIDDKIPVRAYIILPSPTSISLAFGSDHL